MTLYSENTTRKIDSLGRVSIPKSMRDRLDLREGQEVEFFLLEDAGTQYVCLKKEEGEKKVEEERMKIAVEVLKELGLAVPEELGGGR